MSKKKLYSMLVVGICLLVGSNNYAATDDGDHEANITIEVVENTTRNVANGILKTTDIAADLDKQSKDIYKNLTKFIATTDKIEKKKFALKLRKNATTSAMKKGNKTIRKSISNLEGKLTEYIDKSKGFEKKLNGIKIVKGAGRLLTAANVINTGKEIVNDYQMKSQRIAEGSSETLENLNIALKAVEFFGPPVIISPSTIGREIINLQSALKDRNKSLLKGNQIIQENVQRFTSGDASLEAYILRKGENITQGNESYEEIRKEYMHNYADFVGSIGGRVKFLEDLKNDIVKSRDSHHGKIAIFDASPLVAFLNLLYGNTFSGKIENVSSAYDDTIKMIDSLIKGDKISYESAKGHGHDIWNNNIGLDLYNDLVSIEECKQEISSGLKKVKQLNEEFNTVVSKGISDADHFLNVISQQSPTKTNQALSGANKKKSSGQKSATAALEDKKTKAEKLWNQNHELALKYEELLKAGKENTDEGKSIRTQLNQTGAEYGALRSEIREQEPGYGAYYDTAGTVAKRTERSRTSSEVAYSTGNKHPVKDNAAERNTESRKLNEQIVEADKLYRKTGDLAAKYAELFKAGKENTAEGRKVRNLLNVTGKKYSNLRAEIRKQDPDYGMYGYFYGYDYPTSWTVEKSLEGYKQENSKQFNDTGSIKTDALAIIKGRPWNELSKSEKVKLGILGRNYNVARGDSKDIVAWGYNVFQLVLDTSNMPEKYDYRSNFSEVYTGQVASTHEISGQSGMPNEYSLEVKEETNLLFQDAAQAEIIRQAEERRRLEEERLRREEEQRRREEAANNQEPSGESSSPPEIPPNPGVADNRGAASYAYVVNKPSRAPGDPGEIVTFGGGAHTVDNYQTAPAIGSRVAMTVDCEKGQCTEDMTITGKYQYTSWGEWSGGEDSTEVHFHGIVGIPTVTMPSTGTATYTGAVIGDYYDSNGPVPTAGPFPQLTKTVEVNAIGGTANITADFAARSVSGELNLTHNGGAFADVFFNDLAIDSNNGYNGSLSSATVSGSVDGGFAGPNAEETGGSFHVQRNDGTGAVGIFHARQ